MIDKILSWAIIILFSMGVLVPFLQEYIPIQYLQFLIYGALFLLVLGGIFSVMGIKPKKNTDYKFGGFGFVFGGIITIIGLLITKIFQLFFSILSLVFRSQSVQNRLNILWIHFKYAPVFIKILCILPFIGIGVWAVYFL